MITNEDDSCFTELRTSRAIDKFYELKSVLSDKQVNMNTRRKLIEACVRSRLVCTQACFPLEKEMKKIESCWAQHLRYMVKGGWARKGEDGDNDSRFLYRNNEIEEIVGSMPLRYFVEKQHLKYIAHVCTGPNTSLTKKLLFAETTRPHYRDPLYCQVPEPIDRTSEGYNPIKKWIQRVTLSYTETTRLQDDYVTTEEHTGTGRLISHIMIPKNILNHVTTVEYLPREHS